MWLWQSTTRSRIERPTEMERMCVPKIPFLFFFPLLPLAMCACERTTTYIYIYIYTHIYIYTDNNRRRGVDCRLCPPFFFLSLFFLSRLPSYIYIYAGCLFRICVPSVFLPCITFLVLLPTPLPICLFMRSRCSFFFFFVSFFENSLVPELCCRCCFSSLSPCNTHVLHFSLSPLRIYPGR